MQYLNEDDLTADSYQRFITESSADIVDTIDKNEARAIALVKTYLNSVYDMKSVFGYTIPPTDEDDEPTVIPPMRDEFLVDIIAKITLYKIFKRNAARKVPEDVQKDFEWAIQQLERINSGRVTLSLPPITDDATGLPDTPTMWGSLSDENYYI